MIFKYCVWPSLPKGETKTTPIIMMKPHLNVEIVKRSIFHCCPCAFRRRQTIGVDNNRDEISIINDHPIVVTTPVISLRPNRSTESMYES